VPGLDRDAAALLVVAGDRIDKQEAEMAVIAGGGKIV
jgi:hypothetical protein